MLATATLSALGLAAWHHAGWPLLLRHAARTAAPAPAPLAEAALPVVTVVMPAHNEAAFIAAKLRNLAALDYPREKLRVVVACDGCSDATVALAREALPGLDLHAEIRDLQPNRGKLAVLNETIAAIAEGIVALSDVSAMLPADALRLATGHFAEATLGAVGGTYLLARPGSAGEATYWRYQVAVKRGEAALGAPLGLHGAFWCFRREAWQPLEADTINDDFILPLRMHLAGWRLAYDDRIRVLEAEVSNPALEARRRRRIAAGNAQQLWRLRALLHPRQGGVALAFASGKALRVVMPFLLGFAMLGSWALATSSAFFAVLAGCEALGLTLAALGAFCGAAAPKPLAVLRYLASGHLASAVGVARYLLLRPRQPWRRAMTPAAA